MQSSQDKSYYTRLMWAGLTIFVISVANLLHSYGVVMNTAEIGATSAKFLLGINSAMLMAGIFTIALMKSLRDQVTIRKLAYKDELTGLINRRRFYQIFKKELEVSKNDGSTLALLTLDLDRFKVINDCHGHEAGDKIIQQFAQRIGSSIRDHDVLCRMSGDEFALLAKNVTSEQDVEMIGDRVLKAMKAPFVYEDKHIYAGVSIGAVVIENGSEEVSFAMRMADFALLQSKEMGRSQLVMFDPEMEAKVKRKADLEIKLREALATDSLAVKYHPMIDHEKSSVRGVEALVRWDHPELGNVPPSEFIQLAEELALMDKVGDFVLKRACQEISKFNDVRLAINVTSAQFLQESFVDTVAKTMLETRFNPTRLELELKQDLLSNHAEIAKKKIEELRRLGIQIALDDFGTGISSMKHIRDLKLDRVKLDHSFTQTILDEDDDFLPKMVSMASSLGSHVTVEGVETNEQANMLTDLGCDELQGFYFSKPLTAEQLAVYNVTRNVDDQDGLQSAKLIRLAG